MNEMWKFLYPILRPYKWHYFMMFQIPMVQVAFHVLNSYALKLIVDTSTNERAVAKWDLIYPILIFVGIGLLQELSGGQRQRIAIARAILKNAPILILDEATSAIDSQAEQEIQKSINSILDIHNATVIAIAHRLSTIKHMDKIIVIEDGTIVEDGPFQELIAKDRGKFKEMWDSQVNGMLA